MSWRANGRLTLEAMFKKRDVRPREVYWFDMPPGSVPPEFVGSHPGIVVRGARIIRPNADKGGSVSPTTVVYVPITTLKDDEKISDLKPYEVLLSPNPNPTEPKRRVKAVCNHIYTASLARISPYLVGYPERKPMFPRISDGDMARVCQAMLDGVVALRTFHEQEIERVRAELQGKMAGEIDEEVMRRLDEMTRP